MKFHKIGNLSWIFVLFLLGSGIANAAEKPWLKLHGMVDEGKTKLYWENRDWPSDLYGFDVKRRDLTGTSMWVKLNQEPISPALVRDRDWRNLGLNDTQIQRVEQKFDTYLANNARNCWC